MGLLYFIRHGQASFGQKNYDLLSPTGILQAQILGNHLAGAGICFEQIYCGDMVRQKQTAGEVMEIFNSAGIPFPFVVTDPAFDEYDAFAVWKNQTSQMLSEQVLSKEDIHQAMSDKHRFQILFERIMMRWITGDHDLPGELCWRDFVERVHQGISTLISRHDSKDHIAVFTSGGPISIAMQKALGLSYPKTMEASWQVMNASVSRFYFNSRGFFLSGFNDISHLYLRQDARLLTYR